MFSKDSFTHFAHMYDFCVISSVPHFCNKYSRILTAYCKCFHNSKTMIGLVLKIYKHYICMYSIFIHSVSGFIVIIILYIKFQKNILKKSKLTSFRNAFTSPVAASSRFFNHGDRILNIHLMSKVRISIRCRAVAL